MTDKKKSSFNRLLPFGLIGCLPLCLVVAIAGGIFLWTQMPTPEAQTESPVPQPTVPITAQTMEQVKELYLIPLPGYVYDVAWSPDGQTLAVAVIGERSDPSSVELWDAITGRKLRSFDQIGISRLAFSPDGQLLAGVGDSSVIVWNLADGRELSDTPLDSLGARSLAFSPDGRILAYKFRDTVNLLEMPGGGVLNSFKQASDILEFTFLPGGKSMLIASISLDMTTYKYNDAMFIVWDIASGRTVRTFTRPGGIKGLTVAPDGKSLATEVDSGTLMIWDMESGQKLQLFTGFRFGVPRFAFSPDGSVLAVGEGVGFEVASPSGLRLFDVTTGREVPILKGHTGVIFNVAFSPDGRLLATASEDKTVRLWGVPPDAK
jgi:WD40 repeat protein